MTTQSFVFHNHDNTTQTTTQGHKISIESDCGCNLYIDDVVGFWYLKCRNTCDDMVKATCIYKIHNQDGTTQKKTITNHIRAHSETVVDNGNYDYNYCEVLSVSCEIVE